MTLCTPGLQTPKHLSGVRIHHNLASLTEYRQGILNVLWRILCASVQAEPGCNAEEDTQPAPVANVSLDGARTTAQGIASCARIMIVEDESIVALDLKNMLRRLGHSVVAVADTGTDAIYLAGQQKPDLILMDIRLRGTMDGIEAANVILQRFGIPIIFLTAQADDVTRNRAQKVNAAAYLTKPFAPQELAGVINDLTKR